MRSLQNTKYSINEKLENSYINLFSQNPNVSPEALCDAPVADMVGEDNNGVDSDGSESSDQDEADEANGSVDDDDATDSTTNRGHLNEQIEFHNGRQRRKVFFGNDVGQSDLVVSLWDFVSVWKIMSNHTYMNETSFCFLATL